MEQNLNVSKPLFVHEQVRINKFKTVLLIASFAVLILGICYLIGYVYDNVAMGFLIGAGYCAFIIPIQIISSKSMLVSSVHGRAVNENSPNERRVRRLVEGLSISAGLKEPPQVFIIPTDTPNAFAGGLTPEKSYIGVTEGLLAILDDSELEGVIGHEMSHIIQRDVLISTIAIALMSITIFLAGIFYRTSAYGSRRRSRSDNNGGGNAAILILLGLVVYLVARLLANLINLAISRKREYAADATAVRLCSSSEGLARALEKIAGVSGRYDARTVSDLGGDEMLCLYIYNPKKKLLALFSTHPPIEERIARLRNMY